MRACLLQVELPALGQFGHRRKRFVEPDMGPDPFWCCLRTGLPVAAVGSLQP